MVMTTNKPKLRTWKSTKDRMALKSSAFVPKEVALGGRQLLGEHMESHYRRIQTARPAVDTAEPNSMSSHIKLRNKTRKQHNETRARTALQESRIGSTLSLDGLDLDQPVNGHDTSNVDEVDKLNMVQRFGPHPSFVRESSVDRQSLSSTALHSQSNMSLSLSDGLQCVDSPRVVSNTTSSQRYPHRLKERYVLKSNDRHQCVEASQRRTLAWKPSGTAVRDYMGAIPVGVQMSLQRSSQKRRERGDVRAKQDIRKLDRTDGVESTGKQVFQTDDNHRHTSSVLGNNDSLHNKQGSRHQNESANSHADMLHEQQELAVSIGSTCEHDLTSLSLSSVQPVLLLHKQAMAEKSQKRAAEERELQYLQFVSEVTSDILTRGVYSDQALQLVFKSHVERRKADLDEDILYQKLDQLKIDLGLQ